MEPYKVLLADDEEDIRVGISQKMDWAELGFTAVGEADNGQDALELAESLLPDVVLTDIKMPFLDGLELCRILTEQLPASKFVVFSGFDDFEYAKQAIQMNVSEYILKPINAAELSAVLRRLKDQLDRERTERQNMEFFAPSTRRPARFAGAFSIPVCWTAVFLLARRLPRARRLDIDLYSEGGWVAALAHIGNGGGLKSTMAPLSIQQLLEENLSHVGCKTFLYNDAAALIAALQKGVYRLRPDPGAGPGLHPGRLLSGVDADHWSGCSLPAAGGTGPVGSRARAALDYRAFVGRAGPSISGTWSLRAASVSPLTNLTSTRLLPL